MAYKYLLEVVSLVAIAVFCIVFIYTSSSVPGTAFRGSDTAGSELIANLSHTPEENFQPLIPQWVPPSPEIESTLFALQATIGGLLVGGIFGYWIGQKKKT
jgi:cobalt/nickel transport protein